MFSYPAECETTVSSVISFDQWESYLHTQKLKVQIQMKMPSIFLMNCVSQLGYVLHYVGTVYQ
jgi:hypothetical protein